MAEKTVESGRVLIGLLSGILNGRSNEIDLKEITPEVCKLAEEHHVLNMVCYAVGDELSSLPDEISEKLAKTKRLMQFKEAVQEIEKQSLMDLFEQNKIKHMVLKGSVIKEYYPTPDMRTMSDLDFVIEEGHTDEVRRIMCEQGYELYMDCDIHDIFYKKPVMNVEIHEHLIDECFDKMNSYFGNGFERAVKEEGFSYRYRFNNEDFLVFLFAHLSKHYFTFGTGLRSVMDVWVFIKHFVGKLDFEYLSREFEKLELSDFFNIIINLSFNWFGKIDGVPYTQINTAFAETYVLSNGVYGSAENKAMMNFVRYNSNVSKDKAKYYIDTVFPGLAYMSSRYMILKKLPFLLPIFWIVRIVQTYKNNRKNIDVRMKGVAEMDRKKFNSIKSELEKSDIFEQNK